MTRAGKPLQSPCIIPIFFPHMGCPHHCVFCNQTSITGVKASVSPDSIVQRINSQLRAHHGGHIRTEIAFYGGSFTGMEREVQVQLLSAVQPLIRKGLIDSVRVSTRPDYIDSQTLDLLKEYGVLTVELGVQSMVEGVLRSSRRGHTAEDVLRAVKLLHERGFEVGVQIMVGLPGDDAGATAQTVDRIIQLNPHFVRIYPTLILKGTLLEQWYRSGRYTPLSLGAAVDLCKRAYLKFHRAGIPVIRLGLQSSPDLETKGSIVAGPYHPAFGHLVESSLFYEMASLLLEKSGGAQTLRITVSPSDVSNVRGQKNRNLHELKERFGLSDLQIEADERQPRGSLILMNGTERNGISYRTIPFS